ncbi:hypothetical protein KQ313_08780 [Synechococcus sp. CS-1325]|nr:hypothetical protein [Synechococcus sp. CS-1325]MCT0214210.1 hypothetical protein [Synechococcus sp. CS-1326]MCT0231321.1 hypothetical protein [Synechococcus sp. CS-1324]MCT0232540.1 hypothetical protein [Synechococcus sp. CS-1327]PZV01111.1 MAG: hypothetical protein DCF24_05295 [Cyanobium sp.]
MLFHAMGSLLPASLLIAAAVSAAPPVNAGSGSGGLAEAVQSTRTAAEAVLSQSGTEHCLRGKLTNALLGLSASCEAHGQRSELCAFTDRVVVTTGWTVAFMEATSRQLLELSSQPLSSTGSGVVASPRP